MKTKIIVLMGAAMVLLFAGCASQPVSVASVGPVPGGMDHVGGSGYLRVYSATQRHVIAENTFYFPHTSYTIYDRSGTVVQFVRNHTGSTDQTPTLVTIPAGEYNVVAQSGSYGRMTIPVVIEDGRMTVVHLDRNWNLEAKPATNGAATNLVRLPDGETIGWKAN